jgi:anti-anti-sigma factor
VEFRTSRIGKGIVVYLSDKLTVGNSADLRKLILDEFETNVSSVTIDFSGTRFIDSFGLEILTNLSKEIGDSGVHLTLLNVDLKLQSFIELAALDSLFDFQEND